MRMYKLSINDQNYDVKITSFSSKEIIAEVNGKQHTVSIRDIVRLGVPAGIKLPQSVISRPSASPVAKTSSAATIATSSATVNAPIPGQIKLVLVKAGDSVIEGQKMLILEAMKLENEICASKAGVIKRVLVSEGATVIQDQVLVEME